MRPDRPIAWRRRGAEAEERLLLAALPLRERTNGSQLPVATTLERRLVVDVASIRELLDVLINLRFG